MSITIKLNRVIKNIAVNNYGDVTITLDSSLVDRKYMIDDSVTVEFNKPKKQTSTIKPVKKI